MTLAEQLGKFEPSVAHRYRLYIDEVGGTPLLGAEAFEIAIKSTALPNMSSEEMEIHAGSEKIYYAGKVGFEASEIVIKDFVDNLAARFIINWFRKVYDANTGLYGYKADYAGTARIQLLDPAEQVFREWKLENLWPQAVNHGDLADDSNEPVNIAATFRYDKAKPTVY